MGDRAVHIAIRMFTSIETRIAYVYKSIVALKSSVKLQTTTIWECITNANSSALFFVTIFVLLSVWYSPAIYDCHPCLLEMSERLYRLTWQCLHVYPKTSWLLTKPNRKEESPFIFEEEHKKENFRLCLLIYNTCGRHNTKLTVRQPKPGFRKIRDDVTILYPQMTMEPKKEPKKFPKNGWIITRMFILFFFF